MSNIRCRFVRFCAFFLLICQLVNAQQSATVKDCEGALTKDYFSYAQTNSLQEDYLKTINAESWKELQETNKAKGSAAYGKFTLSFSDDYSKFDKERNVYLETQHYTRNSQQALNILQITTADRAYAAYEKCLQTNTNAKGPTILVWAKSESMREIELRVKYVNSLPRPKGIELYGTVTGGGVAGQPAGILWSNPSGFWSLFSKNAYQWDVGQEGSFTIQRARGVAETKVMVRASDGQEPVSLTFKRADALLTLTYVGTRDVPRRQNRVAIARSPNNHENKNGPCHNGVGRTNTGICISRTPVVIKTSAPLFFSAARAFPGCAGEACAFGKAAASKEAQAAPISDDGLSAATYFDNWGSAVDVVIWADESERLSAASAQCVGDKIPVIKGPAVLFAAVTTECLPIATLKWKLLTDLEEEGAVKFGYESSLRGEVLRETFVDNANSILASYKLNK